MRILLVTHSFPKYPGDSTAPFMGQIAESLSARGHEVDVVLPHHPEFRYAPHDGIRFIPYRYTPNDRWSTWGFGGTLDGLSRVTPRAALLAPAVVASLRHRVAKMLASDDYDVVHAHWLVPSGWAAAGIAAKHRTPLVVSLHGSDLVLAERLRLLRRPAQRAVSMAGAVTTASDDLRRRVEELGADPATTHTVHYGVDTTTFAPGQAEPAVRERLGAAPGDILVLGVGRLIEVKGFRYLVEAVAGLEHVHVAVAGEGGLRAELEQLANNLHAPVSFVGNLDHPIVSKALAAADVVAIPSIVTQRGYVDGLPSTLLEALAAGRAVVTSAVGGIPEVVTHGSNGLLVGPMDVRALTAALVQLRDDPDLRDRLGREARRRAVEELDWNETAKAFEHAYAVAGAT
jgi:glycosyltransferase involved in cell wall biosynthesis